MSSCLAQSQNDPEIGHIFKKKKWEGEGGPSVV